VDGARGEADTAEWGVNLRDGRNSDIILNDEAQRFDKLNVHSKLRGSFA
jgi:hypothetical protein